MYVVIDHVIIFDWTFNLELDIKYIEIINKHLCTSIYFSNYENAYTCLKLKNK